MWSECELNDDGWMRNGHSMYRHIIYYFTRLAEPIPPEMDFFSKETKNNKFAEKIRKQCTNEQEVNNYDRVIFISRGKG